MWFARRRRSQIIRLYNFEFVARGQRCYRHCSAFLAKNRGTCDGMRIKVSRHAGNYPEVSCYFWSGLSTLLPPGHFPDFTPSRGGTSCVKGGFGRKCSDKLKCKRGLHDVNCASTAKRIKQFIGIRYRKPVNCFAECRNQKGCKLFDTLTKVGGWSRCRLFSEPRCQPMRGKRAHQKKSNKELMSYRRFKNNKKFKNAYLGNMPCNAAPCVPLKPRCYRVLRCTYLWTGTT